MKTSRHFPAGMHPDIRRQQIVQNKREFIRRNSAVRIKMDHLPQRVHPRVGTGGAGDGDRMAAGFFQGFLQHLLDRQTGDLALPAGVTGSVIFHSQENTLHSSTPSSTTRAISSSMAPRARPSFRVSFSTRMRVRPSPP